MVLINDYWWRGKCGIQWKQELGTLRYIYIYIYISHHRIVLYIYISHHRITLLCHWTKNRLTVSSAEEWDSKLHRKVRIQFWISAEYGVPIITIISKSTKSLNVRNSQGPIFGSHTSVWKSFQFDKTMCKKILRWTGAAEYTDCISAEG